MRIGHEENIYFMSWIGLGVRSILILFSGVDRAGEVTASGLNHKAAVDMHALGHVELRQKSIIQIDF
jgi:hypothetical protein